MWVAHDHGLVRLFGEGRIAGGLVANTGAHCTCMLEKAVIDAVPREAFQTTTDYIADLAPGVGRAIVVAARLVPHRPTDPLSFPAASSPATHDWGMSEVFDSVTANRQAVVAAGEKRISVAHEAEMARA